MFDLDGTLVNTLADIAAGTNHALAQQGRPTLSTHRVRELIGNGARRLFEDALGQHHLHLTDQCLAIYEQYFSEHGSDSICLYPGIEQLLDELADRGLSLAVLSNKPDFAVQQVMDAFFDKWSFVAAHGHFDGIGLKPDPTTALQIATNTRIDTGQWLYLGDTEVDMQTARAAGMHAVGVLWGFRNETELRGAGGQTLIAHPLQALDLL